ncbi:18584_t:CDS:2, partial [Gigaspora rosea]
NDIWDKAPDNTNVAEECHSKANQDGKFLSLENANFNQTELHQRRNQPSTTKLTAHGTNDKLPITKNYQHQQNLPLATKPIISDEPLITKISLKRREKTS